MLEIRFHGRGGQGAVVASELLATALFMEGKYPQAFPAFGVERRGAPVMAFLRVDDRPIRLRCQIAQPDGLIILDPTLIPVVDVTSGLKEGGWILINSEHSIDRFNDFAARGWKVAVVPASAIAVENNLGTRTNPIVNTAILGALVRLTDLVSLETLLEAIESGVPIRPRENRAAARQAFESLQTLDLILRGGRR